MGRVFDRKGRKFVITENRQNYAHLKAEKVDNSKIEKLKYHVVAEKKYFSEIFLNFQIAWHRYFFTLIFSKFENYFLIGFGFYDQKLGKVFFFLTLRTVEVTIPKNKKNFILDWFFYFYLYTGKLFWHRNDFRTTSTELEVDVSHFMFFRKLHWLGVLRLTSNSRERQLLQKIPIFVNLIINVVV